MLQCVKPTINLKQKKNEETQMKHLNRKYNIEFFTDISREKRIYSRNKSVVTKRREKSGKRKNLK
jgi:hypothetical protein